MPKALSVIIRILIGLLLLPVVMGSFISFHEHMIHYPRVYGIQFYSGAAAFLVIFLFFYQFWGIYEFGQKIMSAAFRFTAPFERFFANLFPFYMLCLMVLFFVTTRFFKTNNYDTQFMYLIGLSVAMHIILCAQDFQQQEKTMIKPTYICFMPIAVISTIILLVLGMDLIIGKAVTGSFFNVMLAESSRIYTAVFDRIVFFR